jgi:hypothetical protein
MGDTGVQQVEVAVIGAGRCEGIRAETPSRSSIVDKLHICHIRSEFERHVDFLTSYPPGDSNDGQLWGPMRDETNSWFGRIHTGLKTPHASAAEGHRNLLLTMAMDLSAKRGAEIRLPLDLDELYR